VTAADWPDAITIADLRERGEHHAADRLAELVDL